MIKIKTNNFPFGEFVAITIWPCIFYKTELSDKILNHEKIHGRQQKELLLISFYLIYFIEWIFKGYDNISFEKEAYANQDDKDYLNNRKLFAQWR